MSENTAELTVKAQTGRPSPTQLLLAWSRGETDAFDQLVPLVHAELHRLARRYMARERPGHTLQATALVNEACVRLIDLRAIRWQDRTHFFAMAARIMRRILVDFARARRNEKRGGGAPTVRSTTRSSCRRLLDVTSSRLTMPCERSRPFIRGRTR
jgi:RNA polymerase sigma factor (TIGR02999 family)